MLSWVEEQALKISKLEKENKELNEKVKELQEENAILISRIKAIAREESND